MTWYPSATKRPISGTSTRTLTKDILCLHTAVGGGLSTWAYFNRPDVDVYSHGVICGIWGSDAGKDVDGLALQMADTDFRAAANLDGNWHVIAWETGDNGERPIKPWTPAQCDSIVGVMVDANRLDGIPLTLIPDTRLGRRGVAYHRQGCDPYRVAGGELWSSAFGKDCPTDARIQQLPGLIARARAIVAGQEEDSMATWSDADSANLAAIRTAEERLLREGFRALDANGQPAPTAENYSIRGINNAQDITNTKLDLVLTALAGLPAAIAAALEPAPPPPPEA